MNEWNEIRMWIIETNTKKFKTKDEREMCLAITPQIRRRLEEAVPRWEILNETIWQHVLKKYPKLSNKKPTWSL